MKEVREGQDGEMGEREKRRESGSRGELMSVENSIRDGDRWQLLDSECSTDRRVELSVSTSRH